MLRVPHVRARCSDSEFSSLFTWPFKFCTMRRKGRLKHTATPKKLKLQNKNLCVQGNPWKCDVFPVCTLQIRSYQRCDKRTGTASCSISPKETILFSSWKSLCLATFGPKKTPKVQPEFKGKLKGRERLFFFFFAPVRLSDFPHLVGEVQVFDSLKVAVAAWGGDGFTKRSFETSQGWAQWQLVNCQLVLITEVAKFTSHWNQSFLLSVLFNSAAPFTIYLLL